jgi:glutamyl-tRNA reductase
VQERRAEVPAVERIVVDEFERYSTSLAARSVAPLVSSLHDRAEEIRQAELARFESRLRHLGPSEREALEAMTKRVVAKLLHTPTVNLKAAAGTAKGEGLADAFRDLFDLET